MGTAATIFSDPVNGNFGGLVPTHVTGKNPVGVFWMDNRPKGQTKALEEERGTAASLLNQWIYLDGFTTKSVFYAMGEPLKLHEIIFRI